MPFKNYHRYRQLIREVLVIFEFQKQKYTRMVDEATLRSLAMAMAGAEEMPHFEKTSFRVKKKIFATYSTADRRACLKLSEIDQSVFCTHKSGGVYPVPNKWGQQGWTLFELDKLEEELMHDALQTAYNEVTTKKPKPRN